MNGIKFLGTGGARFVVTRQIRKSGGIWITLDKTNLLIDPGPGSLVRCLSSKPKLDPRNLDGIILTHRHIDHSNDINIIIESMTNGGFKKKGVIFVPEDALSNNPVVFDHSKNYVEKIEILEEKKNYYLGKLKIFTPIRHDHSVETYGLNIYGSDISISIISDTRYFEDRESFYRGDILIINVVLVESKEGILHLSIKDAEKIISANLPKLTILTHFGMNMIRLKPWEIAENISRKFNTNVTAARDGMQINLNNYL